MRENKTVSFHRAAGMREDAARPALLRQSIETEGLVLRTLNPNKLAIFA
jgi:hypothetical protein